MTRERRPRGHRTWHQEAEVGGRLARRSSSYQNESLLATVPSYSSATDRQGTIGHSDSVPSKFMMTTKGSEEKFVADDTVQRPLVRSH